jgi:N-acetylglucosamine malate deacetylase 1
MKILIVAAHSDDEALGCAGTMAKHIASGDEVHTLFMTDGVSSRNSADFQGGIERLSNAELAAKIIGVSSMKNFDFPDNKMDQVALLEIVQPIESLIDQLQPDIIYTHHIGDLNIDHQITHKAVMTACRPQPGFCVKSIYTFEVLSSTEWQTNGYLQFMPNLLVDITQQIEIKRKVLEAYSQEMRSPPHSRSIDNVIRLNAVRGNSVGLDYAEAFISIRELR